LPLSTSTLVEVHTSLSPLAKFSNMAPREEDLMDEDPPSINPYEVLGLEKTASADEVKSAYRKAALKHHPGMKVTRSQLQLPHA
jgi:DnaJ-class molecular chaperone